VGDELVEGEALLDLVLAPLADARCEVIYRGINCTDPTPDDGISCDDPADDCDCESYTFHECAEIEAPAPWH